MDEPTAHLDPADEAALTATVDTLRREWSLLVIAHRMSTVETADAIVMLANGTAHAARTYAELLRTRPDRSDSAPTTSRNAAGDL